MSRERFNEKDREERFNTDPAQFVIVNGPNRGQRIGAPELPPTPAQEALLEKFPESPADSGGGAPPMPGWIPEERIQFVTMRGIDSEPGLEGDTFVFLTDSQEWCVDDAEEEAVVRAAHPGAKFARAAEDVIRTRYVAQFDNLDEIGHPAFLFSDVFAVLMEKAVKRGTPLTRAEVETAFPDVNLEE